jgi:CheY-like chemotaxis protein
MISEQDVQRLQACAEVLPTDRQHDVYDDYVVNLFLAVLDFMMKVVTVNKAVAFYRANRRDEVHDLPSLAVVAVYNLASDLSQAEAQADGSVTEL